MPSWDWKKLLKSAPRTGFKGNLVRCVAQGVFDGGSPPSYLFTSGKPGRCNPKGTLCLYMSEDRATAQAEYDKQYLGPQPFITFYGEFEVKAIIDLANPAIQSHFEFGRDDFFKSYRLKTHPTPLQCLGLEISKQSTVAGVRFPSAACHTAGSIGNNFVVYKKALSWSDSLKILGPGKTILEEWP
jgi:RES domain-containing protein